VARKFLGYRIGYGGILSIALQSITRLKDKLRVITKRNRGKSVEEVIREINIIIPGWVRYFKHAQCKGILTRVDEWLRRKLRCYRLKQLKRAVTIVKMLISQGIAEQSAWRVAKSGKGWWRLSLAPQVHRAMGISWWKQNGLKSLVETFESL
jgi:RNA-directed DNA polymerase